MDCASLALQVAPVSYYCLSKIIGLRPKLGNTYYHIIIATIFNEECPTYETDGKFSMCIQEMTENRVSEVKKDHAQNMSRHNKTTK